MNKELRKQINGDVLLAALALVGGTILSSIDDMAVFALGWVAIVSMIFCIKSWIEVEQMKRESKRVYEDLRQECPMLFSSKESEE